jgi:hypothetical protein
MPNFSAERMAEHFTNYLFQDYAGNVRHVQRVSSWLGLLALGIEAIKADWKPSSSRQLIFELGNKRYKVRYNHKIKPKGGIEFVEVEKSRGSPDIHIVRTVSSLTDAADFYRNPTL